MAALVALGYWVTDQPLRSPGPGDLMVTWNRHASRDGPVQEHEDAGGTVLVVENGYFGRNFRGAEWYALAKGHHNGAGEWPAGDAGRWQSLGVEMAPWREGGEEIVVLASRGMGSLVCREPTGWSDAMAGVAKQATGRPVRMRRHPGPQKVPPRIPLEDDLANAWAAITWGSTAGLKAIAMGVPVFYGFQNWIGAGAARHIDDGFAERFMGDRAPMFERVATAMWSIDEIASGEAFRSLLT